MRRILRVCKKVVSAKKLKVMTECVTDIKVSCSAWHNVKNIGVLREIQLWHKLRCDCATDIKVNSTPMKRWRWIVWNNVWIPNLQYKGEITFNSKNK